MTMRRTATLPLLLFLALPLLATETPDYKTPGKNWGKGPVSWIMTPDEEKEFKKLRTDEERASFVKTFWEKRDPTPGTPENEYEDEFWKRVEAAESRFTQMNRSGSLSDRGRVFILLGLFTKSDTNPHNYLVWTYEPSEATGIKSKLELKFAPQTTGALLLDRKELEQYVEAHPETRGIGWTMPRAVIADVAAAPAAAAGPAVEDLSPESRRQIPVLEAVLSKGSGPTDVPFQITYDYYAAVDGTTLVVFTVETPREAAHGGNDAALKPFARLVPATGEGKPANLTGDQPFVSAPAIEAPPAGFVYQARRNLVPGAWKIAVVVEDKVVPGQMGTLVQTINVPDYRGKDLDSSSICLLASFTHMDTAPGPDEKQAAAGLFTLGSFRLIPRAYPILTKGEALSYYYQVYNPGLDPATGKPNLEATYAFFLKDGAAWKPFRKPIKKPQGQVELYTIDMKDFLIPGQKLPADFRLEITVTDKIAGKDIKRTVLFSAR
ncbi:MAG TPA: GWxTD domain-containing protein [Candidatus Polarisedimenticolia bacterium]|nr:GWxTD domain-containing protein [Candidatus Polarisedimenticolia bacterium]